MPGRHALIVATDTYNDPKLRRLRAPTRDAAALADVLRDPEIGDFEVELASNETDAALRRRIAAFFGDRARDSLLLLHFSCHGLKDDSGQLYFAAASQQHRDFIRDHKCPTCLSPCQMNVAAIKQVVPYAKFLVRAHGERRKHQSRAAALAAAR